MYYMVIEVDSSNPKLHATDNTLVCGIRYIKYMTTHVVQSKHFIRFVKEDLLINLYKIINFRNGQHSCS